MCQLILTPTVGSMKTNAFRITLTKEWQVNGKLNFSCKSFCFDTSSILQANYCKGGTKCVQRIITQIWFLSQQFPFFSLRAMCLPLYCTIRNKNHSLHRLKQLWDGGSQCHRFFGWSNLDVKESHLNSRCCQLVQWIKSPFTIQSA